MSRGVNRAIILGRLGADPEVRYTGTGAAITSIRVATSESWNDKQTGEKQERTEWHRIKFFGKLAEIAGEYLRKGSQVYVEGSLRTEKYTDKDGIERFSTDIIGNEMQMLGSSEGRGGGQQDGEPSSRAQVPNGQRNSAPSRAPAPPASRAQAPAPALASGYGMDDDSEIPF